MTLCKHGLVAGGYSSDAQKTTDILDLTTQAISWGGNLNKRRRWFHIATFDYYDQTTTLAVGVTVVMMVMMH